MSRLHPCMLALPVLLLTAAIQAGQPTPPPSGLLQVTRITGELLVERPLAEGARWCMAWNHSVAGFTVHDCYAWQQQTLLLERSHQPDFAAGLGHTQGRGVQRSDGEGGYWIENINEPVTNNAYRLRVGSPAVAHRLLLDGETINLSSMAAGHAVWLRIVSPLLDGKSDHDPVYRIQPEA